MQLPEVQNFEDPQNERDDRPSRPMAMAFRNAGAALLGIGTFGGLFWLKAHFGGHGGPVYWWIWAAIAGFAVAVCFVHAILASRFGARRAGAFLKFVVAIAIAGMLCAVWWYLRPKPGE